MGAGERGLRSSTPEIMTAGGGGGGAVNPQIFFRPFGPQFALTLRVGARGARAPLLDPPLYSMNTYPIRDSLL